MGDVVLDPVRLQVVRYMQVASATLLVTDWLATSLDEIQYIWFTNWGATKILFLLSRYSPFLDTPLNLIYYISPSITPKGCLTNYRISTCPSPSSYRRGSGFDDIDLGSTGVGMGIAELILLMRTYAIYDCSRKVLISLGILWIIWTTGNIPLIYKFTQSLVYEDPPASISFIPGCYLTDGSPVIFATFASLLVIETDVTSSTDVYATARSGLRNPLLKVLYRDGIFFFVILALCSLAQVLMLVTGPREYLDLFDTCAPFTFASSGFGLNGFFFFPRSSLLRVLHSILCCRILLNIRMAGAPTPYSTFSHALVPSTAEGTADAVLDTRFTTTGLARTIVDPEPYDGAWTGGFAGYDDVPLALLQGSEARGTRPSGSGMALAGR
ncbi:hypothetical protein PUNSTDRAFT_138243 [Punctularia strigosozonata HHB-11173 SS5]|uniref:DUF6533 domain-containing protein n=1 Tax=Punctularia strigosozonata (strain HHB-11173) TaxID=741275 RepID=R7S2Y7_PUNST|nr:uncharacterized protein PUNSTDRAFT_138243 [Punctularia strigosozonata HHB-11173 SS5]EIN04593.1 hypothetical protein PUNSTDRAFT_138243 [Punctularia strigosozonata HHB-11173 SS5]